MGFLLDSCGISKVFPWCFYDISMGILLEFSWDFFVVPMLFHVISMILIFLWDYYGMSIKSKLKSIESKLTSIESKLKSIETNSKFN